MSPLAPYGALLLRLALGTMWLAHGLLKVFVFGIAGTVGFFEQLGLPGPLAYLVILAEIGGGLLILLGLHGRFVSLALTPVMLGAAWVHAGNGWVFSAPNGGWEYPVFLIAAGLAHALLGDGALALRSSRAPDAGRALPAAA
ncbi:MAG: DoxX family protein [Alphaproteobacteria bacterium]|nr:DoxX family protein [Alphaproteobacteria bacterium]